MNKLCALGIGIASVALSSCAYLQDFQESAQINQIVYESQQATRSESLPTFHQLVITGPVRVKLRSSSYASSYLEITDNPNTISHIKTEVKNDTLYVNYSPDPSYSFNNPVLKITSGPLNGLQYNGRESLTGTIASRGPLVVNIDKASWVSLHGQHVPLTTLTVVNSGTVTVNGIRTTHLTVNAKDTHAVNLYGVMRLERLTTQNVDVVQMGWISGKEVIVKSHGHGEIYLAGNATLLNTEANDNVKLNLKYLRARRGFINTAGNSETDVIVNESLSAFASDNSNIYYYTHPKLISKYMRGHGSVLFMQIPIPPCRTPICVPKPELPG